MENGTEIHDRIEFHRHAVALMPKAQDADHGVAVMVLAKKTNLSYQGCSCSEFKAKTCHHIKELSHMLQARRKGTRAPTLFDNFKNSLWYHLAQLLWDTDKTPAESIRITDGSAGGPRHLELVDPQNRLLVSYYANGAEKARFIDRFASNSGKPYSTRSDVLNRLKLFTLSENERELMRIGMKTRLQNLEDSFWYRMAYHAFQELGPEGFSLDHEFEEMSGQMILSVVAADETIPFRLMIPKQAVNRLVNDVVVSLLLQKTIGLSSRPVKPVLK